MARTSLAAAKDELYAAFGGGTPTITNVVVVLDYEPFNKAELNAASVVTIQTLGITPEFFRFTVRVYVDVSGGSKVTQDLMDTILMDVDHAVDGGFGESEWRIRYIEADGLLQAENTYECGRGDI